MPRRLRLNGTQTTRKIPASHRLAGRGSSNPPTSSSWNRGLVPPPGPSSTIRASPARMKLAARVTTMSGTPETTATAPMRPDSSIATTTTRTATRTTGPRSCSSISRAAMQLVSTIIAPTDRSMPPEMTITVWAMASRTRVMVAGDDAADLEGPEGGDLGGAPQDQHAQQQGHPDDPALAADEPFQPAAGLGERGDHLGLGGVGVAVIAPSPPGRGRR